MSLLDIAVAIALGLSLILAAIAVRGIFTIVQGKATPTEQKVIAALTPYLYKAIVAGEHWAFTGLSNFNVTLDGLDKKKVADSVYDALPDYLMVGPFPAPISAIKTLIPRERFEELVKQEYEATSAFIMRNENYLKSQIDNLLIPTKTNSTEPPVGSMGTSSLAQADGSVG